MQLINDKINNVSVLQIGTIGTVRIFQVDTNDDTTAEIFLVNIDGEVLGSINIDAECSNNVGYIRSIIISEM
jgi:hypothetical protein